MNCPCCGTELPDHDSPLIENVRAWQKDLVRFHEALAEEHGLPYWAVRNSGVRRHSTPLAIQVLMNDVRRTIGHNAESARKALIARRRNRQRKAA